MSAKIRSLVALALGLSLVTFLPSAKASESRTVPPATRKPNIIVILTDDQTVEQVRVMPNVLKWFRQGGMAFSNSIVNYSACCPSRATLLTGQFARHHGVLWNSPPTGGFEAFKNQDTTLPVALQNAGYETVMLGKYLNGYGARDPEDRYVPPGWDSFKGLVFPSESVYYGSSYFEDGKIVTDGADQYVTDTIGTDTKETIDRLSGSEKPFFMLIGHAAPHGTAGLPLSQVVPGGLEAQIAYVYRDMFSPPKVPSIYSTTFSDEPLPEVPGYNEVDDSDKPIALRRRPLDSWEELSILEGYRAELGSLQPVDNAVGDLMNQLSDKGLLDNTYLFFTSDNGYFHGEHRLALGKYFAYEPSIRVPLLVRGPNVKEGSETAALVSNVDLAPTIADLAGATLLRPADGRTLVPLLNGTVTNWSRATYVEGESPDSIESRPPFDGVYDGHFAYFEYANGEAELYDLQKDPYQVLNRAAGPMFREIRARYRTLLRQLRICSGQECASTGSDLGETPTHQLPW